MRGVALWRFQVPMDAGVVLREQRLKYREGLLICLTQGADMGWGEISPLPGFSHESLEEAQCTASEWMADWKNGEESYLPVMPSVAFGLSCALAELKGELPQVADYRVAPLCTGDPDALFYQLESMPGDKVAKIKVGLYEAVRDGMLVNLLLESIPDLQLRLDANRSWTPLKAKQFAKYVNPAFFSRIAFIEEPCQTPQQSLEFSQQSGINIAWDESLRESNFQLTCQQGGSAVIIKPMLTGSLERVCQQVAMAHELGLTAVISSSLESSLGLTQLARIAAWLTPQTVPGLDTLSLMRAQLVRPWPESMLPVWQSDKLKRVL